MRRQLVYVLLIGIMLAACAAPNAGTVTPIPDAMPSTDTPPAPAATDSQPAATATTAATEAAPTDAPPTTAPPTAANTEAPTAAPTLSQPGVINPSDYTFELVADGFALPLLVTHAGDGSGRIFVLQQRGLIRIIQDGQVLPDPFLDLSGLVSPGGNERGLLGLAFAPDYAQSGVFYVHYTNLNGDTRVARYRVSGDDANRADPNSAEIILEEAQPFPNHNGGHLAFGPDGFLYVGLGDGGSGGDPLGQGQKLNTILGKVLRLDVSSGSGPYQTPPSNPFVGQADAREEIWAYGLRNPWRFTFDRATGDLFIADVGQNAYEEVNYQPAASPGGENYGWNFMEGSHPYGGNPGSQALVPPVAEYSHDEGGCSVTGGYVYRGSSLPELNGVYFYGDYCSGLIWSLVKTGDQWQATLFSESGFILSSFGEDEAGELYACDLRAGLVYKLVHAG
jgi:glucose/arabinose dehydrogenase